MRSRTETLLFETQIVRRAAEQTTAADLESLRSAVQRQRTAKDIRDGGLFMRSDMEFHMAIASIADNAIYPAVSSAILTWLQKFYLDQLRVAGSEDLTIAEHVAIIDAIKRHDPATAEAALKAHLKRSNALYQRYLNPQ